MSDRDVLAKVVKTHAEVSNVAANRIVREMLETIVKMTKKQGRVTLPGFGTFSVAKRAARTGVNPQTGAPLKIKARRAFRFKAASNLRSV